MTDTVRHSGQLGDKPLGRRPSTVVIFGGRSEIGLEVATRLAPDNTVVLAARRADDLREEKRRILEAGATGIDCVEFDAVGLTPMSRYWIPSSSGTGPST